MDLRDFSVDPLLWRQKNDPVSTVLGMNAQGYSEFIDGVFSIPTVISTKTSDHSNYFCQGSDFCANQQPIVERMMQAQGYTAPRLIPTR